MRAVLNPVSKAENSSFTMSEPKRRKVEDADVAAADNAEDQSTVALYSYWRSSCSWRVRIALNMKSIKYEYKPVHLLRDGGEQLKDDYSELNPMKQVPTLIIDGMPVSQSGAILQYLEETRPEKPLLPASPRDRAIVRKLCDIIGTGIQPIQNLAVLKWVMSQYDDQETKNAKKLEFGCHWITVGFEALERELKKTAGSFCFGDIVTLADLYLVPQVYNAKRFNVDLTKFPTICRINDALSKIPEFISAEPANQPDAQ